MKFLQQIEKFKLYLQNKKNASPSTITNYQADLHRFFVFVQKQGVGEVIFAQISPIMIRAYISYMKRKQYSPRTIARRLSCLRSFCKYLNQQQDIKENPFDVLYPSKIDAKSPEFLTETEMSELLSMPDSNLLLGMRDKALLEVLYASGVRVSELVGILLQNVNLHAGWIIIDSKNGKERSIPIGHRAIDAIEIYIQNGRVYLCNTQQNTHHYLFVNNRGGPLSDRSVRRIVSRYVELLALSKKVSPHTIRHTFAMHLYNHGADVSSIKNLLGCVTLPAAQYYSRISHDNIKQVYKNTHPRA